MRHDLGPAEDIVAVARACAADTLVVVIGTGQAVVAQAQTCAAIGPLAREAAPARRINAVVAPAGSDPAAVDAAVAFLDAAASTTGQILTIS